MGCRKCKAQKGEQPLKRNLVMVILLQVVSASAYSSVLPYMYQFVTTPKSRPADIQNTTNFWPGLGESEFVYSLAVSSFAIGEILSSFAAAFLSQPFPYFFNVLLTCLVSAAGGVLYGLATNAVMVIGARFLFGVCSGFGMVFVQSYIGRSSGKSKLKGFMRKEVLFLSFSIIINLSYITITVFSAIISKIPSINPYPAAAWFLVALTFVYGIFFVFIYTETETFPQKCREAYSSLQNVVGKHTNMTHIDVQKKRKCSLKEITTYCVLILYVYVHSTTYSSIYLVNPILTDSFGMGLSSVSYFFLGIMAIQLSTSFVLFVFEVLKIDSRNGLLMVSFLGLIASLVVTDWHGYGENPCSLDNLRHIINVTSEGNDSQSVGSAGSQLVSSSSGMNIYGLSDDSPIDTFIDTPNDTNILLKEYDFSSNEELCKSLSTSEDQCFWNQKSRVTGEECNICRAVCLSQEKSLTFIQFCVSTFIFSLLTQSGLVFYSVVASYQVERKHQELLLGVLYGVGGISRVVSPLWLIATYEKSTQHTYLPMSISAVTFAIVTISVVLCYKWMSSQFRYISLFRPGFYPVADQASINRNEDVTTAKVFRGSIHKMLEAYNSSTSFQSQYMEDVTTKDLADQQI